MRVILAGIRGLLGGWLLAHTLPLLIDSHEIGAWSATGLGDPLRIALATVELLGAALFTLEATVIPGFALLLASFAVATLIHIHHGQLPWWLIGYTVAAALLLYFTRKAARPAANSKATS